MNGYGRRGYPMPQGGAGYNPYSKYPDIAGLADKFMRGMMMMKQMKQQKQQQMWQRGMEEKKMESLEAYREAQAEAMQRPKQVTPSARVQEAREIAAATGETVGQVLDRLSREKPPRPAAYTLRKRDLDKALRAKDITQDQYTKSLFNIKQEMTPDEKRRQGASIRDSNAREMRDFYKGIPDLIAKGRIKAKELRKMVKKQGGGIPTSQQGYRLDMPEKYNRAILNQKDGVATVEDTGTIRNYEDMFKIFQEELQTYPTFKDWLANSPVTRMTGIDKSQMKIWYDIYR